MIGVARAVPLLIGAGLVVFLAAHFGLGGLAEALTRLSPGGIAVYLGFAVAVLVGYALRWEMVCRSLGAPVALARLAGARLAGDAVGNLVPSAKLAGEPVRAAIVAAGGVSGTEASAGVALDRILETVSNMICAAAYVAIFSLTHAAASDGGSVRLVVVGLAIGLLTLSIPITMLWRGRRPLAPFYPLLSRRPGWVAALRQTEDYLLVFFRERRRIFVWGVLASLAVEMLVICEYHYLLAAFGIAVELPTLLLMLVGTGVARAFPTPAGLGMLEGSQVAVLALAAGEPATGFLVGMIFRLHETLWLLIGLAALSANGMGLTRLSLLRPSA